MKPIGGLFLFLLLGVGLYLYLSAENARKVVTAAKPAREAAVEISGQGMRESFTLDTLEKDGKITGLEIKTLDAQGLLAKMYAVKVGDVIVEVGPFSIKDTDADMLKAQLLESGARQHKLIVLRSGQRVELENTGAAAKLGGKTPGGNLNPVGIPKH